ncbi:MAG: hypothetical protein ACPGTU_08290 [Myxococcota bacterium]
MRANTSALIPVLIFATFLRVLRMAVRWDELTLAYAAYAEPLTRSLVEFHPTALIGHWVGLHPPLHGVLHAVTEVFAPIPILWMGMSVLMSLLTVYIVGRHAGWIAALVIATAPVVLLDAAEVNNYPMASLALACVLATARGHWIWFVVSVVFAGWSHLLAGVGAIGVVLWRIWTGSPAERGPIFAWVIIGMLPIVGGVLRLMGLGSTWSQPDVDLLIWLSMIADTIGVEGLVLGPLVVWGLKDSVRAGWLVMGAALLFAVAMGAAAAHQRPYLGLFAPFAALAIAQAVRRKAWILYLVVPLCLCRGIRFGAQDMARVGEIQSDLQTERGIDFALANAQVGDTVWLVSPALEADDDKTAMSPVLWRLRPWLSMPIGRPVDFEYKDYRYGQPREWNGLMIHSSTELDAASFDHVAGARFETGGRLWVVVYDYSPATGLIQRLERVLQPYDGVTQRGQ